MSASEKSKAPFERIVGEHGPLVWRVCRGLLDQHDAEDAWSETFLAAMGAWARFEGNVAGWLVTIAHRKAIDMLRARSRAAFPTDELPEVPTVIGVPDGRDLDLWAALALLPPRQRAAVVHHHLAGVPFAEVATLTGTTETAARKAASDGVQRLRSLLVGKDIA
ncbi:MAG TPA: sigma-70 family RNA polymerase sigma factor [Amnibacterium sp.]|nr:sigma-70 family RNA polymerase sigma factor [Amnibacterium sp.]